MGQNEHIFVCLSSSIGKMEVKIAGYFPAYRILAFEV
eukprot:UN09628